MDNISKQSKMQQSTMTAAAAQFSSSQSFSSTSFSSMRQASATQQSQMFIKELPSNFTTMSVSNNGNDQLYQQLMLQNKFGPPDNNSSNQIALMDQFMNSNVDKDLMLQSNIRSLTNGSGGEMTLMDQFMNAKSYEEKKLLFQNNLSSPNSEEFNNFFRDRTFSNISNISLSRTRAAQLSKTQVTKTVTNKIIRKRKIRKIVNGEVIEEEEEIDEIENEPTTERFVMNDARKFENFDMNVNLKDGGPLFNFNASDNTKISGFGNEEIEGSKLKAIEPPKEKQSLKSIFSIGKKKKPDLKNVGKLHLIIDELLKTEENYVKDLLVVVEEFMPELERPNAPSDLKGSNRLLLFGNIEIICMFHDVQFLTDLRECDKTPDDIASCFLKHRKEFSLYRHFNRNQPHSEVYLTKYESFFEPKVQQLGQLGLRSYLIKPTQRLCRYILLMEELSKECKKHNIKAKDVEDTVDLLKAEIRLGNDLMALDAIKDCHMDLKDQGDLLYRNQFTVQNGKDPEYKAMVFLFEKIILFTAIKLENNLDVLHYKDFIYLSDIGLTECSNDSKKFKVWFHKHTLKPYTLKTTEKETKKKWVNEIRKQLENELEKTKKEKETKRTLIDLKDFNKDKDKAKKS